MSSKYDEWYLTPVGAYVDFHEMKIVFAMLRPTGDDFILDVGVGTGKYLLDLMVIGCEVVGLDISRRMLKTLSNKAAKEGRQRETHLVVGDAETLPFKVGAFNKVVSTTTLEFLPNPLRATRESLRVLSGGGILVLGVLGAASLWAFKRKKERRRKETVFSHAHFYEFDELKKLIRQAGFHVSDARGVVFIPPKCPNIVLRIFGTLEESLGKNPLLNRLGAFLVVKAVKEDD